MILDISVLEESPVRLTLREDATRFEKLEDGVVLTGQVSVDLNVIPGDHLFYCSGQALCEADLECSRCAEPYRVTLQGEVDFSIREVGDEQEAALEEVAENEITVPINANTVDITVPVREALILALPFKPLCREDCRGLCPICGVNRNEVTCECKVEKTDSRWDGLRDLLK